VIYSLRKWARLALQGNPTVLLPLFVRADHVLLDTQLGLAYNAALQAATIALAASGYRASRERKHYITIQSLTHTIGTDPVAVRKLDAFRKKRNI
jgi:hypothetical protein